MSSCVVLVGFEPCPRCVEVFVGGGGSRFKFVGLVDVTVREARGRVRAAIESAELMFPGRWLVMNLDGSSPILERHVMGAIAYRGQP